MSENSYTIIGNLTKDPELRYTSSGIAVVSVNIAKNNRKKNAQTQEWEDGEPMYMRGTAWREHAENIANTFAKGDRIIAIGELRISKYTTKDGEEKQSIELNIEHAGVDLKWHVAKVAKATKGGGAAKPPADDPWAVTPAATEEPPF